VPPDSKLTDARVRGAADAEQCGRDPTKTPELLGWFGATSRRELALRRSTLALRVPAPLLAQAQPLIPGAGRRAKWGEFVERLAFWGGVRASVSRERWLQLTRGVPVLLYHSFTQSRSGSRYILTRRAFGRQMRALAALRYEVISFEELATALRERRLPPPRAAVIAIDDGYADNFELAWPILRRRGFTATIFMISGRVDGVNDWSRDPALLGRPMLSHEQLLQLRDESVGIGAHTRTHRSLPDVPDDQLRDEIDGSREDLELRLGTAVKTFAYPYGGLDERAVAAVQEAGFAGAGTTEPRLSRPNDTPFLIPRIEIFGSDSLAQFLIKLWFGVQ
jgi:peptidoglycan/xylan/chitin deacetylase (PgdA/CDA1 family)